LSPVGSVDAKVDLRVGGTTYTWSDAGEGRSLMHLRNRGEPRGFTAVAAPVMAAAMRRANVRDLSRLKAIFER
jgi:hypothetical protein